MQSDSLPFQMTLVMGKNTNVALREITILCNLPILTHLAAPETGRSLGAPLRGRSMVAALPLEALDVAALPTEALDVAAPRERALVWQLLERGRSLKGSHQKSLCLIQP